MNLFLAFDPYKIQIRCYCGNQTLPEITKNIEEIELEAAKFASSFQLLKPRRAYITSTRQGVTLVCEIACTQAQHLHSSIYSQMEAYAKAKSWKVSRK